MLLEHAKGKAEGVAADVDPAECEGIEGATGCRNTAETPEDRS